MSGTPRLRRTRTTCTTPRLRMQVEAQEWMQAEAQTEGWMLVEAQEWTQAVAQEWTQVCVTVPIRQELNR